MRASNRSIKEKETWPNGMVTWALSTSCRCATIRRHHRHFGIARHLDLKRAEGSAAKDAAEQASRTKSHF
jgi:hypothetical protein